MSISRRNRRPRAVLGALLVATGLTSAAAHAEPDASVPRPVSPDPGEIALELVARPASAPLLCSPRICVHGTPGRDGEMIVRSAEGAFDAAERALDELARLGLPAPLPDGGAGGSFALDLYLERGAGAAAYPDLPAPGAFDRASAFARIGVDGGPACATASAVTRALAQGILLGLDRAIHEGVMAMHSSYLASVVSPCPAVELAAIDAVQRRPERAITDAPRDEPSGALLFPWLLDVAYGRGAPGSVGSALLAIAAQPRPGDLLVTQNEPDWFDALREVLPPRGTSLGDLLLTHAVARAFVGSRSDGAHLPGSAWVGDFGRVRFDWSIDHRSLPRRLAPARPIAPTGSAYIWLDLREGARGGVRIIADWETQHAFSWSFVEVDAEGKALAAHEASAIFGRDRADVTITDLGQASGLLVVGTHLGNDDRSRPFDPDRGPPRVASFELTIHPL